MRSSGKHLPLLLIKKFHSQNSYFFNSASSWAYINEIRSDALSHTISCYLFHLNVYAGYWIRITVSNELVKRESPQGEISIHTPAFHFSAFSTYIYFTEGGKRKFNIFLSLLDLLTVQFGWTETKNRHRRERRLWFYRQFLSARHSTRSIGIDSLSV